MPRKSFQKRGKSLASKLSSRSDISKVDRALGRQVNIAPILRVANDAVACTTSGAGVLSTIIGLGPTNFTNIANLITSYDEYRVLGAEIRLIPAIDPNITNVTANSGVVLVYDNDDASTSIGSVVNGMDYQMKRMFNPTWTTPGPVCLKATCYSLSDPSAGVPWASTGNLTAFPRSFKLYATGLPNSTLTFTAYISIVVEFRGQI
jgi:hypothetical protein